MRKYILFILIGFFISCSNPTEDSFIINFKDIPIVNALVITNETGVILGVWYNPGYNLTFKKTQDLGNEKQNVKIPENNAKIAGIDDGDIIPTGFSADTPFPNPGNKSIVFRFTLPYTTNVSIWIGPATLGNDIDKDVETIGNHVFIKDDKIMVKEFASSLELPAGYYHRVWHSDDYTGNPVPSGFYRVYFLLDQYLVYRDVFIANDYSDVPESMMEIINL